MHRFRMMFCAGAAAALLQACAFAFEDGAPADHTGGFLDQPGQDCTQCHFYNSGLGGVELIGFPARYRPGGTYDLIVRVYDAAQISAGFQISIEGELSHAGGLTNVDANTRFASIGGPFEDANYVTHSLAGYEESRITWAANGGAMSFPVRWEAPGFHEGDLIAFVAALAGNSGPNSPNMDPDIVNDHFYATHARTLLGTLGDAEGDFDIDLRDYAGIQLCFGESAPFTDLACAFIDGDLDDTVSFNDFALWQPEITGPTALQPAGYVLADVVRGGLLYDNWWRTNGSSTPPGTHPLYPPAGPRSGSITFRCKECHGWDYLGVDGAYGSGSHFTGIAGIAGSTLPPQAIFHLLKDPPSPGLINGHNMAAYGMSDADLWDVVKFTLEGTVDTTQYVGACSVTRTTACSSSGDCPPGEVCDPNAFVEVSFSELLGNLTYGTHCASCHDPAAGGDTGTGINFGTPEDPSYVGTVANQNPWEFLHKVRFGHPGSPMPSLDLRGLSPRDAADLGVYAATLPQ